MCFSFQSVYYITSGRKLPDTRDGCVLPAIILPICTNTGGNIPKNLFHYFPYSPLLFCPLWGYSLFPKKPTPQSFLHFPMTRRPRLPSPTHSSGEGIPRNFKKKYKLRLAIPGKTTLSM